MVLKYSAVCLVTLAMLGSFCDAQYGTYQNPSKKQILPPPQQEKMTFETPLKWKYPEDPKPEVVQEVPFEIRPPAPAASVAVECREADAHVEVKKDLFGTGHIIDATDLTLGNCGPVAEDNNAQVLIYEALLQDCGSELRMTEDSLIYTFTLNYNPRSLGNTQVVRTSISAVIVECHYPRKHNVSSLALDPLWVPYSAVKIADELLYFHLKLKTDDWMYDRPSQLYYLGHMINIEASAMQFHHVPLRIFVDNCVAVESPETASSARYAFIEDGCMIDARITGSNARFLARIEDNKLRFQLDAFRFQNSDTGLFTITCHLKATSVSYGIDSQHRACSYINGWREASGVDSVCNSCEPIGLPPPPSGGSGSGTGGGVANTGHIGYHPGGSHPKIIHGRKTRQAKETAGVKVQTFEWEGDITLGPIRIEEKEIA